MPRPPDGRRPLRFIVGAAAFSLALSALAMASPAARAAGGGTPLVKTGPAVAVRGTSATLTGSAYPSGFTRLWFEYGVTAAYGVSTVATEIPPGISWVDYTAALTGLAPGTTYHFRAVAAAGKGGNAYGQDATFVTPAIPTAPPAVAPTVTTGGAIGVGQSVATLTGTANPSRSAATVTFVYGTSTAYGSSTAVTDIGSGNRPVGFHAVLTGLAAGTTYHYRAIATNKTGRARGSDRTLTTSTSPVVTTGRAVAKGSAATLTGAADPSGSSTSVTFQYGTSTAYDGTTPAQAVGSGHGAVSFRATITGLVAGTVYHYRAVATNQNGTSLGADRAFTATAAAPRPTPTPTPSVTLPAAPTAPTPAATSGYSPASSSSGPASNWLWSLSGLILIVAVGVILAAVRLRPQPPSS